MNNKIKVPYMKMFDKIFEFDENEVIDLNSIKAYSLKPNGELLANIKFMILFDNGIKLVPLENGDKYVAMYKKETKGLEVKNKVYEFERNNKTLYIVEEI